MLETVNEYSRDLPASRVTLDETGDIWSQTGGFLSALFSSAATLGANIAVLAKLVTTRATAETMRFILFIIKPPYLLCIYYTRTFRYCLVRVFEYKVVLDC